MKDSIRRVSSLCVPAAAGFLFLFLPSPLSAQTSIVNTKHNLSVSGPGPYKALSETRICLFCHAPHNARIQAPLWNREDSVTSYLTYKSSTLTPGLVSQPNGSTKLCLSCHDGTIALGNVVSLNSEISMASGRRYLQSGSGCLGTNLRDDHPVSFSYAASKGGTGQGFRLPSMVTPPVRLDSKGMVQCTSCHDPHKDMHGMFLRTEKRGGKLCLSCHDPLGWTSSAHRNSTAGWNGAGLNPWPKAAYTTVEENACENCHTPHGGNHPERLLVFSAEEENCLRCHNGNVASKNIQADISKPYAHNPASWNGVHDPAENPLTMARHVECQDCHNAHYAHPGEVEAPGVPGPLEGVSGIDSSGNPVSKVSFGYQVCYKCHADNHGSTPLVPRVLLQMNVRLEFSPANPSFHPVEGPGKSSDVPSLLPPWTTSSVMTCWDCHAGDGSSAGGPHGSSYPGLLKKRLETADYTTESSSAYALCYECHSRSAIIGGMGGGGSSGFRLHRKHVVNERTPCTVCHDPHGISSNQGNSANNSRLINFDTRVVFPSKVVPGVLRFEDRGYRRGSCTLLCHGKDHADRRY